MYYDLKEGSSTHQRELVGDSAIRGQLSTESKRRKHLVTVVVLDDLPHSLQGHGVGIHLVRVHVMQRSGLRRIPYQDETSQSW